MKKKKNTYLKNLKKYKWTQWKASRLRSDWRSRAKKLGINPESVPTRPDIQKWLEESFPFKCYLTGESLTKSAIELDHKEPTSRGGLFSLSNVGITSKYYNAIKGSLSEKEFRDLLKLVSKWEDSGKSLFTRLRGSNRMYRRK